MASKPITRSDTSAPTARSDLLAILREHVHAGLNPELALDLALNELVVRAADATGASAAALALTRDGEMVCRAATGLHVPDLGTRLSSDHGLSSECVSTRQSQLCVDAELDSRVDSIAARRLEIRSILVVPILESGVVIGVIEVFSPKPNSFAPAHELVLESFADIGTSLRQTARDLAARSPLIIESTDIFSAEPRAEVTPSGSDFWTKSLAAIVVLCVVGLSAMILYRVRWLHPAPAPARPIVSSVPVASPPAAVSKSGSQVSVPKRPEANSLLVYDRGKVVFQMNPVRKSRARATSNSSSAARDSEVAAESDEPMLWLAPEAADSRLVNRVEPDYPAEAITAHRSGNVTLEVAVGVDGSVMSIRSRVGDPLLVEAATAAVRQWKYEPVIQGAHAKQFLTEVTLPFALPN